MKEQRTGFTLVELIVVAVCGSLMLGLSLPMLQVGREEANRLACLDNLTNIAMAAHDYNDVNGQLPPFMGAPNNLNSCNDLTVTLNYQLTYSLTQLLDFTGHSDLADLVDPFAFSSENATIQAAGYAGFTTEWLPGIDETMPGIANIAFDVQIAEFRCPSDPKAPTDSIYFGFHPTNSGSPCTWNFLPGTDEYSITNYVGNIGAIAVTTTPSGGGNSPWFGFYGPMRSRQSDSVEGIADGASNVVLFGESLGAINSNQNLNRRFSMAMGGLAIGRADVFVGVDNVFGTATEATWFQFGSAHPDVVNIVRADASTQSVNRAINSQNFGRMCGVADGLPFFDFAND